MPPDSADRRRQQRRRAIKSAERQQTVRTGPSIDDAHEIQYFQRHPRDDPARAIPGREFLGTCDANVRAKFAARLIAVAAAPPHRFAGGGYWEAMHGDMTGRHELRCNGRDRSQHRLFCLIDTEARGASKPWLVVITGMSKAFRTTFTDADYKSVRDLGEEYRARNPRSVR